MMCARNDRRSTGFTLVELLVVVVLIALLLGILIPALSRVRATAKDVATQSQLQSISQACSAYESDYNQLPGYFAENEFSSTVAADITATQNMMLSLMGQVNANATDNYVDINNSSMTRTARVALDRIGEGPRLASGRIEGAYYSPKNGDIVDAAELTSDGSSPINDLPHLVDGANSGMPILYFRKNPAGSRISPASFVGTDTTTQFSVGTNQPYLTNTITNTAVAEEGDQSTSMIRAGNSGNNSLNNFAWVAAHPKLVTDTNDDDVITDNEVFAEASVPTRGDLLLIAPGEDRTYLSETELNKTLIESFDDLDKFDDTIVSGG